jgi:N-acetylglutamate synthase-like GNAT family acetyltransferase
VVVAVVGGLTPRLASPDEVDAIQHVIVLAYGKYLARFNRLPRTFSRDYLAHIRDGRLWVVGEPVVGVVSLSTRETSLVIENLAVLPNYQGRGVGHILIALAEEQARLRGLERLELFTNVLMTENLEIFRRFGFDETERRTGEGMQRVFFERSLLGQPTQQAV